jgi:hypothetical protein
MINTIMIACTPKLEPISLYSIGKLAFVLRMRIMMYLFSDMNSLCSTLLLIQVKKRIDANDNDTVVVSFHLIYSIS